MSLSLALLLLLAALIHAAWNALLKRSGDRLLTLTVIIVTGSSLGWAATPLVSFPPPATWPLLAGAVVVHNAYYVFLLQAYRFGDLSHVYPLSRGLAPLLVAGMAAGVAGEVPGAAGIGGLLLVSAGIAALTFAEGIPRGTAARAVVFAGLVGIMIAGYTVIDGLGIRWSRSPWDFIVWLLAFNGIPLLAIALMRRSGQLAAFFRQHGKHALVGGLISCIGFCIVLFALSRGTMAHVAAIRETSVLFAAIIGAVMLRESFGAVRIAAAAAITAGLVLLQFSI